jgi:hypothetical protein
MVLIVTTGRNPEIEATVLSKPSSRLTLVSLVSLSILAVLDFMAISPPVV